MREFSADYLQATRAGMWEDSREALSPLALDSRRRVLDVGCGTGGLTAVLREETDGEVLGVDADRALLSHVEPPVVQGDALRLPFADDAVDLVVCQALLINLPDPASAVSEFARVARDAVAAIEPDNAAVTVASTAGPEERLAERARDLYLQGVDTDVTLGAEAADLFESAGLRDVSTRRYDHERRIHPPYSERDVEDARRKASGEGIETDRETLRASDATPEEIDDLRQDWRAMGREVVEQMGDGEYHRREVVPFYVTVGRV